MNMKRGLSAVLCLALLLGLVSGTGLLSATADGWQDGYQGVGRYTVATETDLTTHGDNWLKGLAPTKDGSVLSFLDDNGADCLEKLTDGSFGAKGEYAQAKPGTKNGWLSLTFDLGRPVEITEILAASPNRGTDYWDLRWIKVFVSDTEGTLFDADNVKVQALKLGTGMNDATYSRVLLQPTGGSAVGRYVGFQFWMPGERGTFDSGSDLYSGDNLNYTDSGAKLSRNQYGILQIGELAVYGEPGVSWQTGTQGVGQYAVATETDLTAHGDNHIAGMTPMKADGTDFAKLQNGLLATDGAFGPTDSYAAIPDSFYNAWASLRFDLGKSVDITQLLVASPVRAETNWQLRWVKVYVSEEPGSLFDDSHLVAQALKLGDDYKNMLLKPQGGKATGSYVGFRFWVPYISGMAAFDPDADAYTGNNLNYTDDGVKLAENCHGGLEIGELAVYGRESVCWETGTQGVGRYAPAVDMDLTVHGDSLIADMIPVKADGSSFGKLTDGALATDGAFGPADSYAAIPDSFYNEWASLRFDLGKVTEITQLLVASPVRGNGSKDWQLRWVKVYVSSEADTLFEESNLVVQALKMGDDYENMLLQPQGGVAIGSYVGFRFWVPYTTGMAAFDPQADAYTGNNLNYTDDGVKLAQNCHGGLEIGELAVYGGDPTDRPLLNGRLPLEAYLCRPGDMYNSITEAGIKFGEGDAARYTDGDIKTMASVCLYEGITTEGAGSQNTDAYNLAYDTPWQVFIYYLGGTAQVSAMSLSGIGPYTAGVDFYVSQNMAELFASANRVYTTGGEKTTTQEGQTVLDPAYDQAQQTHTYAGTQAVTGRYAAFVVTRPYATTTAKGYYYGRVSEMTVTGKLSQPESAPKQTFRDKTTGIQVTLGPTDYDDLDFYKNLGGLQVTVSDLPSGVSKAVDGTWFVAESGVYTLAFRDKAGEVLSAQDMGDRYWQVTFPHTVNHTQTMGLLQGNTIARIRNAYTTGDGTAVVAGSDYRKAAGTARITGNSLQFVYLRYNEAESIVTPSAGVTNLDNTPINPQASQEAKNVLAYLSGLTNTQQFVTGPFDNGLYDAGYTLVKEQFGTEVGLYSAKYSVAEDDGTAAGLDFVNVDTVNSQLLKHYQNGNILLIQDEIPPLSYFENLAESEGVYLGVDCNNVVVHWDSTNINRNMALYNAYYQYMTNFINALKDLESRGVKAYMLRTFVEFDHAKNAFDTDSTGRAAFKRVWQQFAARLQEEGLTGYLLTYAPTAYTDTQTRYPGDAYVDVLSVTMYSQPGADGVMADDYFDGNYSWYCDTGKPIGFSELDCRSGGWATVQYEDRCSWFNTLKDVATRWPRISFVNCWDGAGYALADYYGGTRWYGNDDGSLLVNSPFSVNLKDMPCLYGDGAKATVTTASGSQDLQIGKEYYASDLTVSLTALTAVEVQPGYALQLHTATDATDTMVAYTGTVDMTGVDCNHLLWAQVVPVETVTSKGASMRDYDPTGLTALRFGFDVVMPGVTKGSDHRGKFDAATITVDGKAYPVVSAGALLVSGGVGDVDDLTVNTTNKSVRKVSADKIYSIQGHLVTYTAVVTNITSTNLETPILARPYVAYQDGSTVRYVYGDAICRRAEDVQNASNAQ